MENRNSVNWEKIGVYFAIVASLFTVIFYISDVKERTRALEVKVDHLQKITN